MTQSRLSSLYEALFNIAIGFFLNFWANMFLIPMFTTGSDGKAAHLSYSANWWMGCIYTVNDAESTLPHRGHVFANVVMLLTFDRTYPEGDDRPRLLATPATEGTA